MELTKQQKAGMVVAALAVAVLGLDRFVLGGGGPATASAQAVVPAEGLEQAPQAAARTSKPSDTFAQRLERFALSHDIDPESGVPDAFGTDAVWTISAVIGNGDRGAVRIGKELIRVGGVHDGATLVRVDRDGGVFSKDGREFRAALVRPELLDGR